MGSYDDPFHSWTDKKDYVKWKDYDDSFNSWIDKKDIVT